MIATTVEVNLALLIPVIIAVITAVVGPIILAKQKETAEERKARLDANGELSVRIIDEGRDMRKELRDRIENLEQRLMDATKAFQDALDEIRRLKSENERCTNLINDLRDEVERARKLMNRRVEALEKPGPDVVGDKARKVMNDRVDALENPKPNGDEEKKQEVDDRITALENGGKNGAV